MRLVPSLYKLDCVPEVRGLKLYLVLHAQFFVLINALKFRSRFECSSVRKWHMFVIPDIFKVPGSVSRIWNAIACF